MRINLSEDALIECRQWFWKQDKDRNGRLNWEEFNRMCDHIGLQLDCEKLNKAFDNVDKDRSGQISFAEFIAAFVDNDTSKALHRPEPITPEQIKDARSYFNSEKITRVELIRMTSETNIVMTNDELRVAFDMADDDKDGKISFEQFESIFDIDPVPSEELKKTIDQELAELCKYFWHVDKDYDGKLSPSEFLKMLDILGMKFSHREKLNAFAKADGDGDGEISFKEFANAYLNQGQNKLSGKHLKELFHFADKDKNGVLSKEECKDALQMLGHKAGERRIEKIMNYMDRDANDDISLEEFCEFLDIAE